MPLIPIDLLAELYEHSMDAALVTQPDGMVLYANPAACALFGYSVEEFRCLGRAAVVDATDPRLAAAMEARRRDGRFAGGLTMVRKSGERFEADLTSAIYRTGDGQERTSMFVRDVSERERRERQLREANERLEAALAEVHQLRGLLAICAYCKKIRTADDYWQQLEAYISAHAPVDFSHGICPSCVAKYFPGVPGIR